MIDLAILIPTTPDRQRLFSRLINELSRQIPSGANVKFFPNVDNKEKTTGQKRNELIQMAVDAKAKYIAFFDDDDMPGPTYIQRGLETVASGLDCAELWGRIYFKGVAGNPFHHYIDCVNPKTGKREWWQDNNHYARTINHLNFIRLDLVKDVKFPEQSFGEDGVWSMKISDAGILKTEYKVQEVTYHYFA